METHDLWTLLVVGWLSTAAALIGWIAETIGNRRREKLQREAAEQEIERLTQICGNWERIWNSRGDE